MLKFLNTNQLKMLVIFCVQGWFIRSFSCDYPQGPITLCDWNWCVWNVAAWGHSYHRSYYSADIWKPYPRPSQPTWNLSSVTKSRSSTRAVNSKGRYLLCSTLFQPFNMIWGRTTGLVKVCLVLVPLCCGVDWLIGNEFEESATEVNLG